jgi:hypothetical protein
MPLQIRRGSTAQRLTITPLSGELIYDTTTGELFVGDGVTPGGAVTTGVSLEDARDAAAGLLTSGVHSGITFTYNDALDRIDATVTIGGTGPFDGDINGSVFADDSTILVDGTEGGAIRGKLDSSAPLNVNQVISTSGSGLIRLLGNHLLGGDVETNMPVRIKYPDGEFPVESLDGFSQIVHANVINGPVINFVHTRGTAAAPLVSQVFDSLGAISFIGHDGVNLAPGATITCGVDSTPTNPNNVAARIRIATSDGTTFANRYEFDSDGVFKTNFVNAFSGSVIRSSAHIQLNTQRELRFADADSSNYVALRAPSNVASNVLWTLPNTDGLSNNVLVTNGAGSLGWASVSSLLPNPLTNQLQADVLASDASTIINHTTKTITADFLTGVGFDDIKVTSNVELRNRRGIRFGDDDNSNFVILTAPTDLTQNVFFTLPFVDGVAGSVLLTNGSGNWYFDNFENALPNSIQRDIVGSVFADNSTLLVDAVSGTIPYGVLSGAPVLSTVATSGSYNDLSDQPNIPSSVSDLSNDLGFISVADIPSTLERDLAGSVFADDSTMLVDGTNGVLRGTHIGDLVGSVFADNSSTIVNAVDNRITTNSVSVGQFLQLPVFADDTARAAAISVPTKGMVIMMESGTLPAATDQLQVFNGTAWVNV